MNSDSSAPDATPPASHLDLLEQATFGHLATIRPDGSPQSSVMWFEWTGSRVRFTHTRTRQKARNLEHEPRIAMSIQDLASPYRTLEVRGVVESIEADPDAAFYRRLQARYGMSNPVIDADLRIVITVRPTKFVAVRGGLTSSEQQKVQDMRARLADFEATE